MAIGRRDEEDDDELPSAFLEQLAKLKARGGAEGPFEGSGRGQ